MHDDENAAKKTLEQCTSGAAGKGRLLLLLGRWVAAADQEKIVIAAHLKTSRANGKKL